MLVEERMESTRLKEVRTKDRKLSFNVKLSVIKIPNALILTSKNKQTNGDATPTSKRKNRRQVKKKAIHLLTVTKRNH